tara:strand:- start:17 stop:298 length:282 start_codon:yes stop_codon:yes gene_type:complete
MKFKKKDLVSLIESYLFCESVEEEENNSEENKRLVDMIKMYQKKPKESQKLTDLASKELNDLSANEKKIEPGKVYTKEEFYKEFGRLIRVSKI